MNKPTDNDTIKALECCNMRSGRACSECPYHEHYDKCITKRNEDIVDLISRLKAQNKEFDEKIVIQMGTIKWQAEEINRQKAEIERKTIECERLEIYMDELVKQKLNQAKSEAIKEYHEKVKDTLLSKGIYPVVVKNVLEEVEKEMVGD